MSENARKPPYDAARIETERQAAWTRRGDYDAPVPPADGPMTNNALAMSEAVPADVCPYI